MPLDAQRFATHFSGFVELAKAGPGPQVYLDSLEAKHVLFARGAALRSLEAIEVLLEAVFPARRKLFPVFEALGADTVAIRVAALLQGDAPAERRIEAFGSALPLPEGDTRERRAARRKLEGAARDFAAELLHFSDPATHPLATRWAGDAVREFAASEAVPDANQAREWLLERIAEQGIYRDRHWWADLVLATAYVGYFRAMTGGTLGSDFTRGATPEEQLRKILGIEAGRPAGRSRVKKAMAVH